MPTSSDNVRAAASPVLAASTLRTLDLTSADAEITLAAGAYELVNGAGDLAVCGLGQATTALPPSSGAAEVAGAFVVPAAAAVTLALDASTVLHARLLSGTGTLYITRKAVA